MIGQLIWTGERRFRTRFRVESICGIPILRAELPGLPDDPGAPRRKERALRRMEQEGCRRLMEPSDQAQLPPVSTRSLWQSVAAPLTLSFFLKHGQRPERARVALESDRVTRPLFSACCQLIPAVRSISLSPCLGDEELAWWLERQYGVPVTSGGGDVTVCFTPGPGPAGACLPLGEEVPFLPDFTLDWNAGTLPENYPKLPLLSVLWETGRIRPEDLRVVERRPQVCSEKRDKTASPTGGNVI